MRVLSVEMVQSEHIEKKSPGVSVIVPVYNDAGSIDKLIRSLLQQDYDQDIEIIVVDNRSTDATRDIVRKYPVTLLEENEIQSSYAARNKGIEHARHKILAFIDSDCVATTEWVRTGVSELIASKADLLGGRVEFVLSPARCASEMYDAITHFDFEVSIEEQRGTGAGNLFVYRYVFEQTGLFPVVKSGGDFQWSKRAIQHGFRLAYSPITVVRHPARRLRWLIKKRFRTGSGVLRVWIDTGLSKKHIGLKMLRMLFPRRLSMIRKAVVRRGTPDMNKKILQILFVSYFCSLVTLAAVLRTLIVRPRD
ncbi:MAG TPA: glycosyltransferase [Anaerohalosphaeraceae bacterium]|jgi:glycosyltransferase involved in cell wall biosynthesis|nr:glycosyltransferase [Anaerohalosphaeraceae bacterium]HRT49991.1 glycosyltransferase [Anaerohalosphaeraceae bacterium]HRT85711.1 glycosyltransferase [Anaerohalosphaeraceae bacterium]